MLSFKTDFLVHSVQSDTPFPASAVLTALVQLACDMFCVVYWEDFRIKMSPCLSYKNLDWCSALSSVLNEWMFVERINVHE